MDQSQCVFCSIAKKQIKSFIVYEDETSVAFLDINPRSKGMTIVVPRTHYKDFDEEEELSAKVFLSAERVAHAIKQTLSPLTVFISVMPSQVPHFHVKVYPVYENEIPLIENQPKPAEESELSNVAQSIASSVSSLPARSVEEKPKEEEKPTEKKEEKKKSRSKEDTYWIRRGLEIA